MGIFKKAFLFFVGALSIAYEEASKAVREQQKRAVKPKAAHAAK